MPNRNDSRSHFVGDPGDFVFDEPEDFRDAPVVAEYEDRPWTWRIVEAGDGYAVVGRLILHGYEGEVPYGPFRTLREAEERVEAAMAPPIVEDRAREIVADAVEGRPAEGYSERERQFRKNIDRDVAYLEARGGIVDL